MIGGKERIWIEKRLVHLPIAMCNDSAVPTRDVEGEDVTDPSFIAWGQMILDEGTLNRT